MNANFEVRETLSLNRGWYFSRQEAANDSVSSHRNAYMSAKTQCAPPLGGADFDDSSWEKVDLPHDFVAAEIPVPGEPCFCGCRKRGSAWYRRHFRLNEADRGKNIELLFGGIATTATVYFNGAPIYRSMTGYTGFSCDVTPMALYGDFLNTVAVHVDASSNEGWWYEGGGIYRDVWLIKRAPQHFTTDGIFANPVKTPRGEWLIPIAAEISNTGTESETLRMEAQLFDAAENPVSELFESADCTLPIFERAQLALEMPIAAEIKLWSVESPTLYTLRLALKTSRGERLDNAEVKCGFRTLRFDANEGFFLNEMPLKIKGTCNHQDHAGVGCALPKSIERFRLLRLKEMGCNAIRASHNPPSASLLELCDELGMLVMDEVRHFSSSEESLAQLRWLLKRDRNHPSVMLWSILNEEPLQGTSVGYEMARKMCAIIKQYDTTRPTTAAMNGGIVAEHSAMQAVDVMGINYYPHEYDRYHAFAPGKPVISTEDTSGVATRGALTSSDEKHELADNDDSTVPWGAYQRKAWEYINTRKWMCGGFTWTGFDYRGEPNPYIFPSNVSYFGVMDLCGFPKNGFFVRQALWRDDLTILKIASHWNRNEPVGTPVKVLIISNKASAVEVICNGKSYGKHPTKVYDMNEISVNWEPGRLEAISFDAAGKVLAKTSVETTGNVAALRLFPERETLAGDGYDTIPVTVTAVDAAGRIVPDAMNHVRFSLTANGVIAGVGNGNQNSLESDVLPERDLFNGLAQLLIRTKVGGKGNITLRAESDGVLAAETSFTIIPDAAGRRYAEVPEHYLQANSWIRAPHYFAEKPDPNVVLDEFDMNSWEQTKPGTIEWTHETPFAMFRTTLPGAAEVMILRKIAGKAEFYMNGQLLARKDSYDMQEFKLALPLQASEKELTVIFESSPISKYCGLMGLVLLALHKDA